MPATSSLMKKKPSPEESSASSTVRFAPSAKESKPPPKRPNSDDDDEYPVRRQKRPRIERPNEDEMDDVDEYEKEEDDDLVPSERQRLEAKRARREQRQGEGGGDVDDDEEADGPTSINDTTSLATEGVEIEPFHMENEKSDGTGYFDGDTYVFRKRNDEDEPDAWVESLKESGSTATTAKATESSSDSEPDSKAPPTRTKEEWYARIIPLMTEQETIMQAVVRYGKLLKRQPLKRNRKKQEKDTTTKDSTASEAAQKSLNDLTEAANALLGIGDVDIYQKTKADLRKLVPHYQEETVTTTTTAVTPSSSSASTTMWEYRGSQDNQIHGPYSGAQMKAWIQAGYFVGAQAVQIRRIKEQKKQKAEKSTTEDLLSDLMDDDDDEEEDKKESDDGEEQVEYVRGEWQLSDKVNYDAAE